MARSKSIRVTPNVKECLKILKEAMKSIPAGDLKKRANGAINYLELTFEGKLQPKKGLWCPPDKPVVKA